MGVHHVRTQRTGKHTAGGNAKAGGFSREQERAAEPHAPFNPPPLTGG